MFSAKRFFAFEGGGEGERCVRGEVVDDLQHRPPLVAPFGRSLGEDVDRQLLALAGPGRAGQVAGEDVAVRVGGRAARHVEGVGEDADGLALAAQLEGAAGVVDLQLADALGDRRSPSHWPAGVRTTGARTCQTARTPGTAATSDRRAGGTARVTVWVGGWR